MTVLLITCGTSTLKSLLPQGAYAPHVYPRLRKRLSRCTLDCGFKTSESPALRGFVAERCPTTGTSLYLVLKSNGLRHSKNLPVKFGFSPKTVSANIVKKLPPQRCSKPFFNFSHKRPTFAFTSESGYTLGFLIKIAHGGSHAETGTFPSANTVWLCAASEIFYSAALLYTYISRFSVAPHYRQKRKSQRRCHCNSVPNHSSLRFSTSRTNAPRSLSHLKVGTHSALLKESHTAAYTPKQGLFRMGALLLPSERSARSQTSPGRVSERCTLPLLVLGREVLSKNAESLRNSDALMRVAVPRHRGPTGLRDLFRFCRNCGLYALRSGPFRMCEARGGITIPSARFTCC